MKNKEFYYSIEDDQQIGPVSFSELEKAKVPFGTKVWFDGLEDWEMLENIPELLELLSDPQEAQQSKQYKVTDPEIFQHPQDILAINGLKKLKGFDLVVKLMFKWGYEKIRYTHLISNSIKVDSKQVPRIYDIFRDSVNKMDMNEPFLFIESGDEINAYATGVENPYVVLSRGLIEQLDDNEIKFVIGHELGHIKCNHVLYSTLMGFLADFASVISSKGLGLATIITQGMEIALYNWYRKSELSCDRAGLLVCEDIDACITTLIKLAGGAKDFQGELNKESFIEQADLYKELDSNFLDLAYKYFFIHKRTHPDCVVRAKEIKDWSESNEYKNILSGNIEHIKIKELEDSKTGEISAIEEKPDLIDDVADVIQDASTGIKNFFMGEKK
jgi:Zn-dependent protease with chaperone function